MTVEEEVEMEVDICDYCGLSDDKGELVKFKPFGSDHDSLHFHPPCYDKVSLLKDEAWRRRYQHIRRLEVYDG